MGSIGPAFVENLGGGIYPVEDGFFGKVIITLKVTYFILGGDIIRLLICLIERRQQPGYE